MAWPRLLGKLVVGFGGRRYPHIPCDADKGPLVISWSLSQQMALLHPLLQEPAAKPAVTLEGLPLLHGLLASSLCSTAKRLDFLAVYDFLSLHLPPSRAWLNTAIRKQGGSSL